MDELLGMLIGLAKATFNNEKTENTDCVVLRALSACSKEESVSKEELIKLKDLVQREKAAVAPGCATCSSRCGNTDNYDVNKISSAPEEIRELKERILAAIIKKARDCSDLSEESISFIYRALYVVSEEWKEQLIEYANEAEK